MAGNVNTNGGLPTIQYIPEGEFCAGGGRKEFTPTKRDIESILGLALGAEERGDEWFHAGKNDNLVAKFAIAVTGKMDGLKHEEYTYAEDTVKWMIGAGLLEGKYGDEIDDGLPHTLVAIRRVELEEADAALESGSTSRVKAELGGVLARYAALSVEYQKSNARVGALEVEGTEKDALIAEQSAELERLRAQLAERSTDAELAEKNARLKSELDAERKRADAAEGRANSADSKANGANGAVSGLRAELAKSEEEKTELRKRVKALVRLIGDVKSWGGISPNTTEDDLIKALNDRYEFCEYAAKHNTSAAIAAIMKNVGLEDMYYFVVSLFREDDDRGRRIFAIGEEIKEMEVDGETLRIQGKINAGKKLSNSEMRKANRYDAKRGGLIDEMCELYKEWESEYYGDEAAETPEWQEVAS
jgi:hypothetical protein